MTVDKRMLLSVPPEMLPGRLAANAAEGVGPTGAALALLDFRKAYDTIDRGCLLAVMEAVGVGDGVLAWTRTILTHTYASAEVNGFISEPRRYAAGVRQGCPAAPALFLFLGHALACFLRTCPAVCAGLRTLEAAVPGLWRLPLLSACKEPIWRLWAAGALVARAATATESPVSSGSSDSDSRPRHRACVDETQTTLLALPGASGAATDAEASAQHLHDTSASNHISASADTTDALRALSAEVADLRRQVGRLEKELVGARAQPQIAPAPVGAPQTADVDFGALRATVEAQQKQIAALTGMLETSVTSVSHLVSRVPGAPMQTQMPHARAPAKAAQPARPAAAAAAPVVLAAGAPARERSAAAGAARAASASVRAPRGLPAVAAAAQQRHSFVAAFFMEDATAFAACHDDEDSPEARAAELRKAQRMRLRPPATTPLLRSCPLRDDY
ncbi:hypothetical protein FOA52_002025 [Chlamydomonas sp. UWO 241]|nr:hypothetical protein FOA52_002025 [Chlamydomonas sp. UWO 241]